jgi:hypothetical protein
MPHTGGSMVYGRAWRKEVMVMAAAGQEGEAPVPDLYQLMGVPLTALAELAVRYLAGDRGWPW